MFDNTTLAYQRKGRAYKEKKFPDALKSAKVRTIPEQNRTEMQYFLVN